MILNAQGMVLRAVFCLDHNNLLSGCCFGLQDFTTERCLCYLNNAASTLRVILWLHHL